MAGALLFFSLFIVNQPKAEAVTITKTKVFTSLEYDGFLSADTTWYSSYDEAWSAEQANFFSWGSETIWVGQKYDGYYYIYRGFLYFDTSSIPDGATILSANLTLYMRLNSTESFDLIIQNGQPTYPHMPMHTEDYYYIHYTGNGGSISSSEISVVIFDAYNITLTSDALQWINKEGVTKLCLRTSRDINKNEPSDNEYVLIYSFEKGSDYAPKLIIKYSYEGYKYVFHGPFNEDSGLIEGAVNITVYPQTGSTFSFELNESNPSYTLELENKPLMFKWTLAYNYTRIYIPLYNYEEVYVTVPASPYLDYQVQIIDLLGVTNAYLEARTYMNGTLYTVERRQIPGGGKLPLILTQFKTYYFRIICDQGIIDLGSQTTLSPYEPLIFYVTPAQLPREYISYGNITASAIRPNSTCIQIYYNDANERTSQVNITIYSVKNNKLTVEYSQSFEANMILINWKDALPSLDYNVKISVSHADYGQLTWQIPLPAPSTPVNIWDILLGWVCDWPVSPSQIISAFIIFFVITLASYKDAEAGLLLGAITAALLIGLGWYAMSWGTLTIITCLIIMLAIARRRRRMMQA